MPTIKRYSLKLRVLLASTLALLFCMSFMGLAVVQSFESAQYSTIQKVLAAGSNVLLAAAKLQDGKLIMPVFLSDEKFNEVESPIFGMIYSQDGQLLWHSRSAVDEETYTPPKNHQEKTTFELVSIQNRDYFVYDVNLQLKDTHSNLPLRFVTLQPASSFYALRKSFNRSLIFWQLLAIIASLFVLYIAMRWTLTPLKKLAESLTNVESGRQEVLETDYPSEVSRLTLALNKLLENERRQREQYRNAMADLAHSLKTPLAVIHSIQDSSRINGTQDTLPASNDIDEQVQRMNQIISYQLQRAVTRQQSLVKKSVPVKSVASRICQTLNKVYWDKGVDTTLTLQDDTCFFGEEQDLMEVMGNLLENAFRLCLGQITITGHIVKSSSSTLTLELIIEDDGPGISEEKREHVLKRGVREDSRSPGQGIGLAVSMDIIDSYGGQLSIGQSSLGGALFLLQLPGGVA